MIYLVLAAVLWGSSFPVISAALGGISPLLFVVLRFAVAFLIFLAWRRKIHLLRRVFNRTLLLVSIPHTLAFVLQFVAQELTTASKTAVFVNSTPLFVAVFAFVILKERLGRRQLLALGVAGIGVVITSTNLDFSSYSAVRLGDGLAVAVGACWALFIVFSRDVVKKYSVYDVAAALYFWTVVFVAPLLLFEKIRFEWSTVPAVAYLAVFTTIIAYALYLKGVRTVSALSTSIIILIEIIVAFLISHFFLGESFSTVEAAGVVLVLAGVVLVLRGPAAT